MMWLKFSSITQRRRWHPTPVLWPGKSHRRRSLVGCSPWGCEESDTTERLLFHFSLSCSGEGNGNPLQCSCLETPRDGGAWWAAIYGVTQSHTQLKWLSSSNSITHSPQDKIPILYLSFQTSHDFAVLVSFLSHLLSFLSLNINLQYTHLQYKLQMLKHW